MRLIDADALLKVPNVREVEEYDETGEFISYRAVPVEAIEAAPTIEADFMWGDLDYKKQIAAENAELLEKIKQLEQERDAAIRDIPRACGYCKHYHYGKTHECHSKKTCMNISGINTEWEWRGVCEENGGEENAAD